MTTATEEKGIFTAVIDGEMKEYDRHRFFSEVDNKASYHTDKKGYQQVDNATWDAAFKALAKLRDVTPDRAYHWFMEEAADLVEVHQEHCPELTDLYDCEGLITLMEPMNKMQALLDLMMRKDDE